MRSTDNRWLDPKSGLVHQLTPMYVTHESPAVYRQGYVSSYYETPPKVTTIDAWVPLCGAHRKKRKRLGRHEGPLTCLQCIGRL